MNDEALNNILASTLEMSENLKTQISKIYHSTKLEINSTRKQLESLQGQTIQSMNRLDKLMKQEQQSKQNFAKVSSESNISEEDLKSSYEDVRRTQMALEFEQNKWQELGSLGDKTERRLKVLNSRLKQTEEMSLVIGAALHYLSTRIRGFVEPEYYLQPKEKSDRARIIQAQEKERRRVAFEVKEFLSLNQTLDEGLKSQLEEIIFNLGPDTIESMNLSVAIRQLASDLNERGILMTTISIEGKEIQLPKYVETAVFRIVQEALSNVSLHSGVKSAKVRLLYSNSALSILVDDRGRGFDPDESLKSKEEVLQKIDLKETEHYKIDEIASSYYGMLSMRERAETIGAELKIISAKGKGTKVHLKVPYKTEDIAAAVESEKINKALSRAMKS